MLSQQNVKISGLFSINLRVWWEGNGAEVSWDREKEKKKRGDTVAASWDQPETRTPASGTNRPQTMQSTTCVFAGTFWSRCWKSQCKGSDAVNEPTCEKLAWLCRFFVSTQYSSQSCSSLVAAMFFVTAFIWFETPVWSCNALFSYLLVLFTFLLFQFSLESLCHKGGPIIIQLSSLLHSVHHGEQLVQCVSVTAQENRTLISWQHTAKTRHNICFRRTRIFSDKNMCTEI